MRASAAVGSGRDCGCTPIPIHLQERFELMDPCAQHSRYQYSMYRCHLLSRLARWLRKLTVNLRRQPQLSLTGGPRVALYGCQTPPLSAPASHLDAPQCGWRRPSSIGARVVRTEIQVLPSRASSQASREHESSGHWTEWLKCPQKWPVAGRPKMPHLPTCSTA